MNKQFFVYMMASDRNGTLYIGVTSNLIKRVYEHKTKLYEGFTKKYNVTRLVYFKECADAEVALATEKQMKKWNRGWKIREIEAMNPDWKDLYETLI